MRNLVAVSLAALLTVACGGSTSEPDTASLQQQGSAQPRPTTSEHGKDRVCGRPFHGPSWGTTVSTVELPLVHNVFTGSAILSGAGRSAIVFTHDWNVIDKSVTGSMTITAASGDTLYASVTGTALPTPDGLSVDLDQFATIDGGSGRFEGAGGSFSIVGTLTRATAAVTVYLDGRLVLDPSCD
ncbi:MAG TPA: hypothetical protein VFM53_07625 [Anaeromyxobacteraceae bacterium]|nr:hypothetical protein [Anaeromyxobacteraceae bacterium]